MSNRDYRAIAYQEAASQLRQDVREFWTRSGYFTVVEGGLLSAYGISLPGADPSNFHRWLGAFALLTAVVWLWVTIWSVIWIGRWLAIVERIEAIEPRLRVHNLGGWGIQRWSAVQGVTMALPLGAIVGWLVILDGLASIGPFSVQMWTFIMLGASLVVFVVALYSRIDIHIEEGRLVFRLADFHEQLVADDLWRTRPARVRPGPGAFM